MRLNHASSARLPADILRFGYDRSAQAIGIVHLGIGAFHRAHQAWYTDRAMDAGDLDWCIQGVSLRSSDVAEQLNPQDGLYSVTERSATGGATRLIGAVKGVLNARQEADAVIAGIAAPHTKIISLTVTEKGYCRTPDGRLDAALAEESALYPSLAAGLRRRQQAGLNGLTLLSCDNLTDNGAVLARLLTEYLDRHDPTLLTWFERECSCPSTMVDRIVPATTPADRLAFRTSTGIEDAGMVVTETFTQWVIEDRFAGPRPRWDSAGAEFVANVSAHEDAKLRMLNAAHSVLAYLGLARGHEFVHEAIADTDLRQDVARLLLDEAAPTIETSDLDLEVYATALIARFSNPALNHSLRQIAQDGSQKIPQRWLATLNKNQKMGRSCPVILSALAAWVRHLRGANGSVEDPRAAELLKVAQSSTPFAELFGPDGSIASPWIPTEDDAAALELALDRLDGPHA